MKIDGRILFEAVRKVSGMAGTDMVQVRLKNEKLEISSAGSRTYAQYLPVKTGKEELEFALPIAQFTKNLKGVVDITVGDSVNIRTASFRAELAFQPYLEPEFKRAPATSTLTPDQIYQIETALAYLSLSSVVEEVFFACRLDDTGFKAAAWDRVHLGMYTNPAVKSKTPLELHLNIQDVNLLLTAMESDREGFQMAVLDGFVHAWNDTSRLVMPLLQVSTAGLPQVEGLCKQFDKPLMVANPTDLLEATDRAQAICDVTGSVEMVTQANRLRVVAMTPGTGKFEEVLAVQSKPGFNVATDPVTTKDILSRFYRKLDEVRIGQAERFVWFRFKDEAATVQYGALLRQGVPSAVAKDDDNG